MSSPASPSCPCRTGLSATWRLLWTTEKETLFILKNAGWFGTEAGEVFQVIDVESESLNNVITFPPDGAFVVDSSLDVAGDQRTTFKFRGAQLKLSKRSISLPPFGQGWFDTIYLGRTLRVAKDIRGDTLVVERDGPPRSFS
ncbi:g11581 [Coccomyxa elongata]